VVGGCGEDEGFLVVEKLVCDVERSVILFGMLCTVGSIPR